MIGKMDRRVTFIKPIIENGTSNEDKVTGWEVIDSNDTVWAEKIERSGSKFIQEDRVALVMQTDWRIRFRTDLNGSMRLVYNTLVYNITAFSEMSDESRKRYTMVNTTLLDNIYFT